MALRLTKWQRDEIKYLRDHQHYSRRAIWLEMWIDFTVAYKEYNRNKKRWWVYDPEVAQHKTYLRNHLKKKQCKKIRMNDQLETYTLEHLEVWWSAEAVAGRWNEVDRFRYKSTITITWMSIRRYINSKFGSYIKYHLQRIKRLKKYKKHAKRGKREWWRIHYRIFINDRPLIIAAKKERWHLEVDFIESKKWDKTVILVLIDKLTRFRIGVLLENKSSELVKQTLLRMIKVWNIKSMTFDNDLSFAKHYELGVPTFFCHTFSSWEKAQVEWWNIGYRIFWPKWFEFKNITQDDVNKALIRMNNYPLKCLWYCTPMEAFNDIKVKLTAELSVA